MLQLLMAARRQGGGGTDEHPPLRQAEGLALLFHSASGCVVRAEPLLTDLEPREGRSRRQQRVRSSAGASGCA